MKPEWFDSNMLKVFNANTAVMAQNYWLAPVTPIILAREGFNPIEISLISIAMMVPSIISRLISGWMLDSYGLKKVSASVYTALGLVVLAYSMISGMSIPGLLALAVIHAYTQCAASTAVNAVLNELAHEDYRAQITGYAGMVGFLAMPFVAPVSLWLADFSLQLWGIVIGAFVLTTISLWWLKMSAKPIIRRPLKWGELFDRSTFHWSMTAFGSVWAHGVISSLLPLYAVQELGLGNREILLFFATYAAGIVISRAIAAKPADQQRFLPIYLISIPVTMGGMFALALNPSIWGITIAGALVGLGYPANHLVAWKIANMKADQTRRGKTTGTYWLGYEVAMISGKSSLFLLGQFSFQQMWAIVSVIGMTVSVGWIIWLHKQGKFQE